MIRPFTCLTLVAAFGAGLYLYQVKHRAQMVDRDITRMVKETEQSRDRISLLKTEWAGLNGTQRLATLAAEHLQLQPLQPTQYALMEDLRGRLPPVSLAPATPAAMDQPPVAAATPPAPSSSPPLPMLAVSQAPVPVPVALKQVMPVTAKPALVVASAVSLPIAVKPPVPAPTTASTVAPVQLAAVHGLPKPVPPHALVAGLTKPRETELKPREAALREPVEHEPVMHEPAVREPVAPPHRLFAPVMPAYSPAPVVVHAPTVQTASAIVSQPAPFVGSALGMAHTVLAAPVPVQAAGYTSGQ